MKNNLLFFIFTVLIFSFANAQEKKISIDTPGEKSSTIESVDLSKMPTSIVLTTEQIREMTSINRKNDKNNIHTYHEPKKAVSTLEYNKLNDSIYSKTHTSSKKSKKLNNEN